MTIYRDTPPPECPSCKLALEEVLVGGTDGWQCDRCHGIWMSEPAFWSLFRRHQPDSDVRELLIHNDGTPRRPCPACREQMDISWIDFLQLDRCPRAHGIWFDDGEIQRAVRFDVGQEVVEAMKRAEQRRRNRGRRR